MKTNTVTMPYDTPIGRLVLECDGDVLIGIWLPNERRHVRNDADDVPPVLKETASQLDEYFAGERTDFDLELSLAGSEFQRRVWQALLTIPYGETRSYGEIAEQIGASGAARAVGLANGRNPIAIIVPCHRVIGASGSLTGYGGGLERKQSLLELERRRQSVTLSLFD